MREQWWNDYIGLPYLEKGRDRSGLDCWGLVRLVYAEQFETQLPSFVEAYEASDRKRIAELLAANREGWEKVEDHRAGDVVLMRILGEEAHVGVVTMPGFFLHVRSNQHSVIERMDNPTYKSRIVGVFRYRAGAMPLSISACPHPLQTKRISGEIPPGLTIAQIVDRMDEMYNVPKELLRKAAIMVDGVPVAQDAWDTFVPRPGARVEYRALARGDSVGMIIAMVAIMVVAWYVAPFIMGYGAGAAGWAAAGAAGATMSVGVAAAGIAIAGSLLVASIFPTRMPDVPSGGTGPKPSHMLQGGQNNGNPYGSVPVVLGRHRFTPPLGAKSYAEANGSKSYLRMLLVWGYGPLQVSDLRIGDTPLDDFEEVEYETLNGWDDTEEDKTRFNSLYGQDVTQLMPNVKLEAFKKTVSSAVRASNVLTVTTSAAHGLSVGDRVKVTDFIAESGHWEYVTVSDGQGGTYTESRYIVDPEQNIVVANSTVISVVSSTVYTVASTGADGAVTLHSSWSIGYGFTERTLSGEVDKIKVTFNFPQGLFGMSKTSGKTLERGVGLSVNIRQVGSGSWSEVAQIVHSNVVNLSPAWYNVDLDEELEPVYRWTRVSLNKYNQIIVRHGALTTNPSANPTGSLLTRLQQDNYGINATFDRLPALGAEEEELWQICVLGNAIYQTIDKRGTGTGSVSGCALTMSGLKATIAAGTITRAQHESIYLKKKYKKGFSHTMEFYVPRGEYEVRVARTSDNSYMDNPSYDECYLYTITGYLAQRPVAFPKKLAMTALKIRASNQINGNVDGITGTVQCICPDYSGKTITAISRTSNVVTATTNAAHGLVVGDRVNLTDVADYSFRGTFTVVSVPTSTTFTFAQTAANGSSSGGYLWILRPTRNPASILRLVLQHPANARPLSDSKINTAALADWHNFCRTNKFMYDFVLTGKKSVEDTLRDIAAAGRASPTWVDGKRTVIIDRPRTQYAQFFTPHNSWGFESTRALPKLPHAFRVSFTNSKKGFQTDERIVFNDGYSAANATLYEGLQLPGVTDPDIIHKHARFHLAQLKLRPETYTLNVDIEHLVCTRGDLVRVTHDVPMWGLGTGRIRNRISGTQLELDEKVPMDAGVSYTIRIRLEDGTSVTRTVAPVGTDGQYNTITLTSSVTTTQGAPGNLFMFGALNSESVELVVQSIEPSANMTARLTLVDYSPAIYDSDTEVIPAYDSQITLPPTLVQPVIVEKPVVRSIISDERVMTRVSPGKYRYGIRVAFANPSTLPAEVTHVEGQLDFAEDEDKDWQFDTLAVARDGALIFKDVEEGATYSIRLRYVDSRGRTGRWQSAGTHTVVGKANPPAAVSSINATVSGSRILLDWPDSREPDVERYEVRRNNAQWGLNDPNRVFYGSASTCSFRPTVPGTYTFYVRARDGAGLFSPMAAQVSYVYAAPLAPTTLTGTIQDTATTAATVTLDWNDVLPPFGLSQYEITYDNIAVSGTVTSSTSSTAITFSVAQTLAAGTVIKNSAGTTVGTLAAAISGATSGTLTANAGVTLSGASGCTRNRTVTSKTSTIVLPADWTGSRTFSVKTKDSLLNLSSAKTLAMTMTVPGQVPAPTQDVTSIVSGKATVILDWAEATKGTLAIAGYEIRTSDSGWGTAGYVYRGAASNAALANVSTTAATTWYIRAFDTEKHYSATSRTVTHDVTRPGNVGGVTVTRSGSTLTVKATGYIKPSDFKNFEFRIGQVRVGATSGDDTPDAVVASGDFWADPDVRVLVSQGDMATISLTQFATPRYSTAGVVYRVACRMVDTSGNESAASALGTITVKNLS